MGRCQSEPATRDLHRALLRRRGLIRVTANPYGAHDIPGDYSPEGGKIVFLRNNDPLQDPNSETGALFVVNTDGTGLHRITAWNFAEDPGSWSPNGQWILFSNKDGKVFVVHPDGSGLRQVGLNATPGRYSAYQPTWSPDGTQIMLRLFLTSTGEQRLYTMRPTGSDLRQVANTQGSDEFADWGPHPLASSKT
jgi:TolB protein